MVYNCLKGFLHYYSKCVCHQHDTIDKFQVGAPIYAIKELQDESIVNIKIPTITKATIFLPTHF